MVKLLRLTEANAKDRAGVLRRTVDRNKRLREMAERPLLLTLIAQLQTDRGGNLPEKHEQLYDKTVEMLLNPDSSVVKCSVKCWLAPMLFCFKRPIRSSNLS